MRLYPTLLILLAGVSLAACTRPAQIAGTTPQEIVAAVRAAQPSLPSHQQSQLPTAITQFEAAVKAHAAGEGTAPDPVALAQDMTPSEFVRVMARFHPTEPDADVEPEFPNPVLASRMLALYELQRDLLQAARANALLSGRSVVDQFPIAEFNFLPPSAAGSLEGDRALFRVGLQNNTRFDVYQPIFLVTVKDAPGEILFQRKFDLVRSASEKEPVGPGETRIFDLVCCEILKDSFNNQLMRTLPAGATVTVNLLQLHDHSNRPVLDIQRFTEADHDRLGFLHACVEHLKPRLETWVPPEDGSECLSQEDREEARLAQAAPDAAPARQEGT